MEKDELFIGYIRINEVCRNGYIVEVGNINYVVHYNAILAVLMKDGKNKLFINDRNMTMSDLKTIRGIDATFRKRGDKYTSENYEIIVVKFNVRY